MKHTCSAPPRVVLAASCVCLWLWSVASAVGTRMGAMSRCILAVYTSYKQYITVWTRERPPVRVSCAILKNRLTSAHLGLDPAAGGSSPRIAGSENIGRFVSDPRCCTSPVQAVRPRRAPTTLFDDARRASSNHLLPEPKTRTRHYVALGGG